MFEIMKKTLFFLFAAAAVISAASCQKIESTSAFTPMTLTASFDNVTRTAIDGFSVTWSDDDRILVMDENGNSDTFILTDGEGTKSAKFTQENSTSLTGQLYAIYGDLNASFSSGKINFTIPSTQSGEFKDANICVAKASGTTLAFKNATAIIKVDATSDSNYLHYYKISNIGGYCAGSMIADFSKGSLVVTPPSSGVAEIAVGAATKPDKKQIDKLTQYNATYYYAVAPGTYSFVAKQYTKAGSTGTEISYSPKNKPNLSASISHIYTIAPIFN